MRVMMLTGNIIIILTCNIIQLRVNLIVLHVDINKAFVNKIITHDDILYPVY